MCVCWVSRSGGRANQASPGLSRRLRSHPVESRKVKLRQRRRVLAAFGGGEGGLACVRVYVLRPLLQGTLCCIMCRFSPLSLFAPSPHPRRVGRKEERLGGFAIFSKFFKGGRVLLLKVNLQTRGGRDDVGVGLCGHGRRAIFFEVSFLNRCSIFDYWEIALERALFCVLTRAATTTTQLPLCSGIRSISARAVSWTEFYTFTFCFFRAWKVVWLDTHGWRRSP